MQREALVPAEQRSPGSPPPQAAHPQVAPEAVRPSPSVAQSRKPRALFSVMLGAVVILVLGWTGVRVFRTPGTSTAPPPPVQASTGFVSQTPGATAPAAAEVRAPVSAISNTEPGASVVAKSRLAVHEVIPDVPRGARRSIRGHIRVWVRVIVDQDGSVFAALVDRTGPSRYFQQLAVEAAKKWTFPPVDTPSRRLMQVQFDFTRDGTVGRAVALH